jgi:hypothetical protein
MQFYQIKSNVWLSNYEECYKKIITISPKPTDPALISITKLYNQQKLSPFQQRSTCCPEEQCLYVVMDPKNKCEMLCVNKISELFSYLIQNGFTFNTDLTKIMLKSSVQIKDLIAFITK